MAPIASNDDSSLTENISRLKKHQTIAYNLPNDALVEKQQKWDN